ncbi:MAG: hypothetical protein POELPBGB_02669 [Bacteroidia bacterium]|nr:hypothetical protein [Bacteroidia bacterium]
MGLSAFLGVLGLIRNYNDKKTKAHAIAWAFVFLLVHAMACTYFITTPVASNTKAISGSVILSISSCDRPSSEA